MRLAFVFLVTCVACSNDTFSGEDAASDASTDASGKGDSSPPSEGGSADAISSDTSFGDGGNIRFCQKHIGAVFCDDFDAAGEIHPWTLWTSATNVLTFVAGSQGQGAQAKPTASVVAYLTETINQPAASISFDMLLPNGTILSSTYVRVSSSTLELTLGAPAVSNQLVLKGSDGQAHTFPGDNIWHTFKLMFNAGNVMLLEDGTQVATAPFAESSTVTLDVGYIVAGAGGTVDFDNVLIE